MTVEYQLTKKKYYETFMQENENQPPVKVLGQAYYEEQQKEWYDLSLVRLAQGEVYFHNQDFESAIFKWENVNGEFKLWAKKNTADAHYELGLSTLAEELYLSIETDSKVLKAEIALKLFSLYTDHNNIERAYEVINELVASQPDYPNVTAIARRFYEEQEDFNSAVELAVDECIRTESLNWFAVLKTYVDKGYTANFIPNYFYQVMIAFYKVDQVYFKQLVSALWKQYKSQPPYLAWIKTINDIFLNIEVGLYDYWQEISTLYQETYTDLMESDHSVKELHEVIPNVLTNWLKITNKSRALFPSAAVLSWNEKFPSTIDTITIENAGRLIFEARNDIDGLEYHYKLCHGIIKWANENGLEVGHTFKWWVNFLLDAHTTHLLITGTNAATSSFVGSITEEKVPQNHETTFVFIHDEEESIQQIADQEIIPMETIDGAEQSPHQALVEVKKPFAFLDKHNCSCIITPSFTEQEAREQDAFKYAPLADGLLFVLDAKESLLDEEKELLLEIKEHAPNTPVHFVINNMDSLYNQATIERITKEFEASIGADFPQAHVLAYTPHYVSSQHHGDLAQFIKANFYYDPNDVGVEERARRLLFFIQSMLKSLVEKRNQTENHLIESIKWNEDMLVRLNGFLHRVDDLEQEKASSIVSAYHGIKEDISKKLKNKIPRLLKKSSELVKEDSDFSTVHIELNKQMNMRVEEHLQQDVLPKFRISLKDWIATSNEELIASQVDIEEVAESLNKMYNEQKLTLACDFKVLDDWRRDVNRMANRVQLDEENILLRVNPTQLLLKGAGKLFSSILQNQTLLYNQYKKYIESQDYQDITESMLAKFFMQFNLFEKNLEVDIELFFEKPKEVLKETIEETQAHINENQDVLSHMKANPEAYHDPLTLFQLRLRQYELMVKATEEVHYNV
ncbi:dynamin family protein [Priestia megaterium]